MPGLGYLAFDFTVLWPIFGRLRPFLVARILAPATAARLAPSPVDRSQVKIVSRTLIDFHRDIAQEQKRLVVVHLQKIEMIWSPLINRLE